MALIRGNDYYFLTADEYTTLQGIAGDLSNGDIFDRVFLAFTSDPPNTVVIGGQTYYYTLAANLNLEPLEQYELGESGITLDYQVFRSMATLHPSDT